LEPVDPGVAPVGVEGARGGQTDSSGIAVPTILLELLHRTLKSILRAQNFNLSTNSKVLKFLSTDLVNQRCLGGAQTVAARHSTDPVDRVAG
jgi:hypothetical protein